ncbi:polysaccharide deacetylase family protein [Bacillus sp. FSL K6-3431]|uniref:polysaccharide deacetylase family protein n=1 Tax=Bacillus sp. FSL K6-3431 TaxID=2921500 RepID=UPI0030FC53DD
MTMNPILRKMGFSENDKVLIVHADDVGITQSSVDAFLELLDFGTISCGSTMVPCPWFPEVARKFRESPELDLGLHLTLNCEYETYRWRPISTTSQESGMIDENGYFKQDKLEVMETADPKSIEQEIEAQLKVALNLGVKPTHVDSHSGTLWSAKFMDSYINFYKNHQVLPVVFNPSDNKDPIMQSVMNTFNVSSEKVNDFAATGLPVVDSISGLPVEHTYDLNDRLDLAKLILDGVQPGMLTHFAFHPMKDTPESRGLLRYSDGRIGDYEVFMQKKLKNHLKDSGIQLIGYKDIIKYIDVHSLV